ncbi:ABC-transporter like protein, partial [Spraguea lophii 42_110]
KRTMIAVELVSDPDLIFLDEPTSGLDTYITISFVKLLKEYAIKSGKTIIITIHQPPQEAFRCFDDLLLLAKGKTIYCGETNKCKKFFKSYGFVRNKASPFSDFVLEVLVKEKIENNAIQEMIKQNNLKYDNGQLSTYKQKTRNDMFFDFKFNLKHILLLTKRRFSVYNLTMGRVIFLLLKLLVIGLSIYILHDQTDKYDKNGKSEYSALFSLILIYNLYMLFYFAFITISCSGAIFSILPEYKVIKREIGVQSYSMLSYFCSIYIFEFIEQFPFVLIYIIATYVLLKKFLSFLTIFISFGIFVVVLPSFILLGSITRNSKLLYFLIAIPLIFAFSYTIPFHTVIEDPDFKKLPESVFNLIVSINGIWPLSLFIHLFLYIMIKFFTIERLLEIVPLEEKERIIKNTLEYVYKTMPPVRMPIVTYICYSILMILVYILLCIFLIEIMLQPAMRMKFSNKK